MPETETISTATPPQPASTQSALDRYLPYLVELQKKLFQVGIAFLIAAILGGLYHRTILAFVMHRFDLTGINVVLTSPYQIFELMIQTAIYSGLFVALPLLIYHLLTFLKPALEPKEYKILVSLIPLSIFLFFCGFLFGAWVMNYIISIFTRATLEYSVNNIWDISLFFTQILFSAVALGIIFEFPIVLTVLLRFHLVTKDLLAKNRPFIYCLALIFAAMLPPTDIFSLILLTIPLLFLFEITLLLNRK